MKNNKKKTKKVNKLNIKYIVSKENMYPLYGITLKDLKWVSSHT